MAEIRVVVKEIGRKRRREIKFAVRVTISDLLKQLGYSRETVVTRRNGKIVAEEERLVNGDLIEILPVVTGGGFTGV